MDGILVWLKPLLEQYASQYPWLVTILVVMGSFRLFFKPVMEILKGVVDLTPSQKDNAFYDKMLGASWYKAIVFVIDWLASIKLPKKEDK